MLGYLYTDNRQCLRSDSDAYANGSDVYAVAKIEFAVSNHTMDNKQQDNPNLKQVSVTCFEQLYTQMLLVPLNTHLDPQNNIVAVECFITRNDRESQYVISCTMPHYAQKYIQDYSINRMNHIRLYLYAPMYNSVNGNAINALDEQMYIIAKSIEFDCSDIGVDNYDTHELLTTIAGSSGDTSRYNTELTFRRIKDNIVLKECELILPISSCDKWYERAVLRQSQMKYGLQL